MNFKKNRRRTVAAYEMFTTREIWEKNLGGAVETG